MRDVLLTAPPGCGKTHHLAHLVESLLSRGLVTAPQQVLAVTFSTKARSNLRSRIHEITSRSQRRRCYVANFHGMSYRLYRAHGATLGLDPSALLPQPGWLAQHRAAVAREHGANRYDLKDNIDVAKAGAFDQDETMDRLLHFAGQAGVAYERGLRLANRLDYSDAIRHAVRLLEVEEIARLYQSRFPVVVVDECQDLTRLQFALAERLSGQALILAGDEAQGIYGFAGADAEWTYGRMLERAPLEIRLDTSYRSSPAVLRVVSAVAAELGGQELQCADPSAWPGCGSAQTLRFPDTWVEADCILELAIADVRANPQASVAIMARTGWRRREVEEAARSAGLAFELWDYPVHRPRVVQLLRKHLQTALLRHESDRERLDELFLLCFEECGQDDVDTEDDLNHAVESLEELLGTAPLEQIVNEIRTSADDEVPVSPGLHFLNGHTCKGQQFDHVYVLGLEEDVLPDYRSSQDADKLTEELAVLHVMVSRARQSLTVTCTRDVRRYVDSRWLRAPSRWFGLIAEMCD
ncbi:ATP-dependent helicase [Aquihabitans sp. G128]|uniref:UvrD-helicase domain-containing protein n=1 Tax=Aquihabitans sp. G128 TaxID=2849779 RepID=UPI001C23B872|nr:ATP-dependent helicase [Aquihabitans sp. G128]QXC61598.1 ATP-dependent helicase [Aquihabitans sp. G128]